MYFIYKITNLTNNKTYIGSSSTARGEETRWQEHLKAAKHKSNPCYNYPLQKAIRKYGETNFTYKIIENHIQTLEQRIALEKKYILQFNSLTNNGWGYNQTLYTDCALKDPQLKLKNAKRCALVDKNNNILQIFQSLHEAAKFANCENGVSNITRICNGETNSINSMIFRWIDKNNNIIIPENKTRKRRSPIIAIQLNNPNNRNIFPSILEASKQLNLDRSSIQKCLKGNKRYSNVGGYIFRYIDKNNNIIENEIPLEKVLEKYICINNEYKTFSEWCQFYNISYNSVYRRMKKYNINKAEALQMPKRR